TASTSFTYSSAASRNGSGACACSATPPLRSNVLSPPLASSHATATHATPRIATHPPAARPVTLSRRHRHIQFSRTRTPEVPQGTSPTSSSGPWYFFLIVGIKYWRNALSKL